jgi:hypothetical protein
MIESLKDAFNEVARLPEDEQRQIVELIREELASEKRWQKLLHDPRSEYVLENLVADALAEDEAGKTEEIIGDNFLCYACAIICLGISHPASNAG